MIEVKSPAFSEGDEVPTQFTCDGENISPPSLVGRPRGSRGAARQPDGPRRATRTVHALARHRRRPLSSADVEQGKVPAGGTEQTNDFGETTYGGPCPPPGSPHRYVFTVEALDAAGNALASGRLTTTYHR